MIIMGVVTLIIAFMWGFICKTKEEIQEKKISTPNSLEEKESIFSPLKEALRQKNILLLAFGWSGISLTWIAIYTFWPTYAVENLGLTIPQAGMVLGFLPVASAIASLTSPLIAKKWGYDKPIICASGLILPAMLQTSNIPLLCIASFISGYGAYCFVSLVFTVLYKIPNISPKAVSMGTGFIFSLVGLGGALTGILGKSMGLYNAIALSCLAPFFFFILALFLDETGEKATKKA